MTTFLITTDSDLDASDVRDAVKWEWSCDVAAEKIEVIHEPDAAGSDGQVGLVYRVVEAA